MPADSFRAYLHEEEKAFAEDDLVDCLEPRSKLPT